MSIEALRHFLLCCTVINYGVLILWAVLSLIGFGRMQRLCFRWYGVSAEHFYAINFAGITFYKVCILLFNLVPLIASYLAVGAAAVDAKF
jgi:hypothetical protein